MTLPEFYKTREKFGADADMDPENYADDDYSHINRSSDTAMMYFFKFLAVISAITFIYLFFTGKI